MGAVIVYFVLVEVMGKIYYILNSGSLKKINNSIVFKNEKEHINIPIETVDEIIIYGNVNLTTPVIKLLSDKKIPIIIYSEHGWYISSIYPENYLQSGYVLLRQSKYCSDIKLRIKIASKFVLAAAMNMKYICRRHNLGSLRIPKSMIQNAKSISELMGIEGNIHIEYLNLIDKKLPEKYRIITRTRRPPKNYTNSMMSYLYSVLYGVIAAEIFSTHLSPELSFLHEPSERRNSLSLDVAEVFRPIFCDDVILKLINLKIIKESDFIDENGVYLNNNGKRKILEEFETKLRKTVYIKNLGRKVSNRTLIRIELYKIEKQIMEDKEYKPYRGGT